MKTLDIDKVFSLAKSKKYETVCATFDVVDHIFKVDVPKNLKNRKLAVQAMSILAEGSLQYGYDENAHFRNQYSSEAQSEGVNKANARKSTLRTNSKEESKEEE